MVDEPPQDPWPFLDKEAGTCRPDAGTGACDGYNRTG